MVFRTDRKERLKRIPDFGGKYQVGDLGNVYRDGQQLELVRGRYVNLSWKGTVERRKVAYLVARAFIENEEGRPWVVHKDGNRSNNRVENLEWSEKREEWARGRKGEEARRVLQYDRYGVCVGVYASVKDAAEASGLARYLIARCVRGVTRRCGGFVFRYE